MPIFLFKTHQKTKRCFAAFTLLAFLSLSGLVSAGQSTQVSLSWNTKLPSIPAAKGEQIQAGLAGAFSGKLTSSKGEELTIIAGGANFAEIPLIQSIKQDTPPKKIFHQAIFLLKNNNGNFLWQQASIDLPVGLAYGESVTTDKGILFFGGEYRDTENKIKKSNKIYLLNFKEGKLNLTLHGEMPVTFAKGTSSSYQDKVYFAGGYQNGEASNQVYQYETRSNAWRNYSAYPSLGRSNLVSTISFEKDHTPYLYLFSGSSNQNGVITAQTDGWKIALTEDEKGKIWQQTKPISLPNTNKSISLLGAASFKINEHETLFLGGYNEHVFNNWLKTYKEVAGTDDEKMAKLKFFSQQPADYNWNKQALVFNSQTLSWTTLGEPPFLPNCGAVIESHQQGFILMSGEVMPGVRTTTIKLAQFN